MGWAGGSQVMSEIIKALNKAGVSDEQRCEAYKEIIVSLEDQDWDTQDECEGEDPAFDAALYEIHPDWAEEDY